MNGSTPPPAQDDAATPKPEVVRRQRNRCGGQGMVEYILLVTFVMLASLGGIAIFLDRMGDFYTHLIRLICLPIP